MNWLATIFDFSNSSDIEFIDENFNKLMLKAINENIIGDVLIALQLNLGVIHINN